MFNKILISIFIAVLAYQANAFHEGGDSTNEPQGRVEPQDDNPYDYWVFCQSYDSLYGYGSEIGVYFSELFGGEPGERWSYESNFALALSLSFDASTYSHKTFCRFFDSKREAQREFRNEWRKAGSVGKMKTDWTPDF